MTITKIQKVLRKAIKDYDITANVDEETLIAFLSVDLVREESMPDTPPPVPRKARGVASATEG